MLSKNYYYIIAVVKLLMARQGGMVRIVCIMVIYVAPVPLLIFSRHDQLTKHSCWMTHQPYSFSASNKRTRAF
jgi:hypothetical protein